jgi:dTDP-glucose 4,6-dehydratase
MQIASGNRVIELGAVSPTRDFNFVNDTVRGFLAVADSGKAIGEVINIGSGFEVSVGDTAQTIANVMATEIEIRTDEARLRPMGSEVERLWSSNTKATELTGWRPLYGSGDGFRRGLGETAAWFSNPENLRMYKTEAYNL